MADASAVNVAEALRDRLVSTDAGCEVIVIDSSEAWVKEGPGLIEAAKK